VNSSSVVRAVVETSDGTKTEASKTLTPSIVDLIFEPSSYTPPFYKGNSIFSNQSTVRVVAIPNIIENGQKLDTKNLVFNWSADGVSLESSSGTGRNSVKINGGVITKDITLSLEILDPSGNTVAEKTKILSPVSPKIIFYEDRYKYGVLYNKAIVDTYYLGQAQEVTIAAKPYFFSFKGEDGSEGDYKWSVNGNSVTASMIIDQAKIICDEVTEELTPK